MEPQLKVLTEVADTQNTRCYEYAYCEQRHEIDSESDIGCDVRNTNL